MQTFTTTRMLEPEAQQQITERVTAIAAKMESLDGGSSGGGGELDGESSSTASQLVRSDGEGSTIDKLAHSAKELAAEHCQGCACQMAKKLLFAMKARKERIAASGVGGGVLGMELEPAADA
jgi:hypothetical protein